MNSIEAAALCRYVKACCPQQKFDEYTPDAWFDLLDDIPFEDAKRAARDVAKRQPFVSPAEIRAEVTSSRKRLVAEIPPVDPPWQLADLPTDERRWIAAYQHGIADGLPTEVARTRANYQLGITDEPLAITDGKADELRKAVAESGERMRLATLDKVAAEERAKAERAARHEAARELEKTRHTTGHDDKETA